MSLLKGHRQYLNTDKTSAANHDLFRREEFVSSLSLSHRSASFMNAVLQTQMFDSFIRERQELPTDPEVRFFNESINAKKNRSKKEMLTSMGRAKKETSFLDDTSFEVRIR